MNAADALEALREGNRGFVSDPALRDWALEAFRPGAGPPGQRPIAAVLGCSDSRVPIEILFRQGPGQLFVIRVAGNIVSPVQLGSIEFAAALGVRLVVVLGHSSCGAVTAALERMRGEDQATPMLSLPSITDPISEAIEDPGGDLADAVEHGVHANVRAAIRDLREGSPMLSRMEAEDGLEIRGAVYRLETGVVEWFEPDPAR